MNKPTQTPPKQDPPKTEEHEPSLINQLRHVKEDHSHEEGQQGVMGQSQPIEVGEEMPDLAYEDAPEAKTDGSQVEHPPQSPYRR